MMEKLLLLHIYIKKQTGLPIFRIIDAFMSNLFYN